ncbi:hypothetical protein [Mesorhizobium sp.]|uniref:hypothetical protein n=1 Tax=Mesorhizobium sp. TaxID=1871066 RepID=UPI00257B565A|nr:hypothetical protein [Mesorhizobium sp.]
MQKVDALVGLAKEITAVAHVPAAALGFDEHVVPGRLAERIDRIMRHGGFAVSSPGYVNRFATSPKFLVKRWGITALTPFAGESVSITLPLTNGRLDLVGVTAKMLRERGTHQWLRLLFLAIGLDSTRDRS